MKLILKEDVKKQGKKGDIITVKDGYGNYLITNKLAVLETTGSKKILDHQKKSAKEQAEQQLKEANEIKNKLEKITLKFQVKVGKNDQVFGSISTKQIASELKSQGFELDKRKIKIDTQINTLGITNVDIELHKEVIAKLKVQLQK